jgi:hypothetical protein
MTEPPPVPLELMAVISDYVGSGFVTLFRLIAAPLFKLSNPAFEALQPEADPLSQA